MKSYDHKVFHFYLGGLLLFAYFIFALHSVYEHEFLGKEIINYKDYASYIFVLISPLLFYGGFGSIKLMQKDKLIINEQGIEFGGVDKHNKIEFNNLEKVMIFSKEDYFFYSKKGGGLSSTQMKLVVWNYKIKPEEFLAVIEQAANQFGFLVEDKKGNSYVFK